MPIITCLDIYDELVIDPINLFFNIRIIRVYVKYSYWLLEDVLLINVYFEVFNLCRNLRNSICIKNTSDMTLYTGMEWISTIYAFLCLRYVKAFLQYINEFKDK